MDTTFLVALAMCTFALTAQSSGTEADIQLTTAGATDYTIVLCRDASPSERHGAEELADYLKQMAGAEFTVQKEGARIPEKCLLVGHGQAVEDLVDAKDLRGLGTDGFVIKAVGQRIVLSGGKQRGTMYACYSLLEDVLGCRWYSSAVTVVPKKPTIRIPGNLYRRETPAFENRDPFYADAFDADWAAHNRSTSSDSRLDAERGGKIAYWPFVHSFYLLVPPEKYFDSHPEYFALVNGQRQRGGAQLCLTNPDVLKIATAQVMQWIQDHPEARIISVSQNDCGGACQCERCQAIVKAEGSESGPLLHFVNEIAAQVAEKYPDKLIDTLAYQYTKEPPKTIKPAPNVRVRLCPIEACVGHPFEQCEQDKVFVDLLQRWCKLTNNLYVWHYVTNFANYMQPVPNFKELQADIPMYHRMGVRGLMLQGHYQKGGNGEFSELRAWVEAKMLWDPSRDFDALVNDFLAGYYGPAAPALRKYYDLMHARVMDNHIHVRIYDPPSAPYLDDATLTRAEACFDEAEKAARTHPAYLARVKRDALSIRYVRLCQAKAAWEASGKNAEQAKALWQQTKQFCDDYSAYGAVWIREGQRLDAWEKQWQEQLGAL